MEQQIRVSFLLHGSLHPATQTIVGFRQVFIEVVIDTRAGLLRFTYAKILPASAAVPLMDNAITARLFKQKIN